MAGEVAKQKAADCKELTRTPLPANVTARLKAVSADPSLRSPDEQVMWDWLNADRAEVTKRQAYCGAGALPHPS